MSPVPEFSLFTVRPECVWNKYLKSHTIVLVLLYNYGMIRSMRIRR